ncbi:MAG: DNA polymerase III subunit epsilon [Gammaproteobacteria bacterium]
MRQIVLDTETTGLEPSQGHRIIEIGCAEIVNRRLTDVRYHQFLQPDREIDEGAAEVHGITGADLAGKPRFADVVDDFLEFIRGAELIIHNAPFDVGFLNNELSLLQKSYGSLSDYCTVLDTLALAREIHPGQRHSLDALCKRYGVDNSRRDVHGALLDAELLAEVYLVLTGGQATLTLEGDERTNAETRAVKRLRPETGSVAVIRANEAELQAHDKRLEAIDRASDGACVWQRLEK